MHLPRYSLPLPTALCFLVGSVAWILISDRFVFRLPLSLEVQEAVHTYKGLAFVVTMAPLLYWFLRRSEKALEQAEARRLGEVALLEESLKKAQLAGQDGAGQLLASQQRFLLAFELAPWGIVVTTFQGKTTWANEAALRLLGRQREELEKDCLRDFTAPEDRRQTDEQVGSLLAGQRESTVVEKRFLRPDGTVIWTRANVSLLGNENGEPHRFIHMIEDVTNEKAHALEQAQQLAARRLATAVFEHSGEALAITDAGWRYVDVNAAFERVTGFAKEDLLRMTPDSLLADDQHNVTVAHLMGRALQTDRAWTGEFLCKRRNGEHYRQLQTVTSVVDSGGRVMNYVIVASDLTEQRQLDERLAQMSRIDGLTGLPNRLALEAQLKALNELARPYMGCVGLILLGYDRFPAINELVGSPAGDKVLREGAGRLSEGLDSKYFVARYGGCRFAVVAPLGVTREELIELARHCTSLMETTEALSNGVEVPLTVSAGLSTATPGQGVAGSLINQAESALLFQGPWERGTVRFFSPEVAAGVSRHLAVETGLLQADFKKEFRVLLQPKWDIVTKQVTGAEALLRWESPELGTVSPSEFIPIAEQHGNILEMGRWVLQEVVRLLAQRRHEHPELKVSVNLSARQLEDPDFLPFILQTVGSAEVPPKCLELELTETFLVRNQQVAGSILADLRQHGFSLALDDFGVGYSSLSYLAKFPVDVVKLDHSFIEQLPTNETACVVAASVLELAKRLSIMTVAEGVETEAQRAFLQQAGCAQAQGWLVSPALSVEEFFAVLAASKQGRAQQSVH